MTLWDLERCQDPLMWMNEPPELEYDFRYGKLSVQTGAKTDFWRRTYYGFVRDSGHAALLPVDGECELLASFEGSYVDQYDQAGVMLRVDASRWIKAGIEFVDGNQNASVVHTNDISDWSMVPLTQPYPGIFFLRVLRLHDSVQVFFRVDEAHPWTLMRLVPFPGDATVCVSCLLCIVWHCFPIAYDRCRRDLRQFVFAVLSAQWRVPPKETGFA